MFTNDYCEMLTLDLTGLGFRDQCEKMFSDLFIKTESIGILAYIENKRMRLLPSLARVWLCDIENPVFNKDLFLQLIDEKCEQYSNDEQLCQKPTYLKSPILAFLFDYAQSPIFPFRLPIVLKHINEICEKVPQNKRGKNICELTVTFRRFFKLINSNLCEQLLSAKSEIEIYDLLYKIVEIKPPPSSETKQTYVGEMSRLLNNRSIQLWEERSFSTNLNRQDRFFRFYDLDIEDQMEEKEIEFCKEEKEFVELIENTVEKNKSSEYFHEKKKGFIPRDPLLMATKFSYCWNTPGTIPQQDLLFHFQALNNYQKKDRLKGSIANVYFNLALFYGKGDDTIKSLIKRKFKDSHFQKGRLFLNQDAESTVGCPDNLKKALLENSDQSILIEHRKNYESFSLSYDIPIHNVIAPAMNTIKRSKQRITTTLINEAINQFYLLCNDYPFFQKITLSKLRLTFYGLAHTFGMDGANQYVVTGRILYQHKMSINYTQIEIQKSFIIHFEWINSVISRIEKLMGYSINNVNTHSIPWLQKDIFEEDTEKPKVYIGSWSIPKRKILDPLIQILKSKSVDFTLPPHESHNYSLTYLALISILLMLSRPFEFEDMEFFPGISSRGTSICQKVKSKKGKELFMIRDIPEQFIPLYQKCVTNCLSDYSEGKIWCLRDEFGNRLPFSIKEQFSHCLELISLGDYYIRPYGLRHLGRTLHRDFGFVESFIDFKMNHDSLGRERLNLSRVSYVNFPKQNQDMMRKIIKELRMD
ncbi:MAG: hypothetical protein CVU43_00730 [Chloroflexi bacterium HGW-Chloroflexi-5]|nr:MAG: hypothetical protein CVU43_00730 [Chloroflexi bacterium HGW-Chloroflexi-5]